MRNGVIMYIYVLLLMILSIWYFNLKIVGENLKKHNYGIKSINKLYSFIAIFFITLVMGLRDKSVGIDTSQYYNRYQMSQEMLSYEAYQSEYGFNYINYFFHDICNFDFQIYLFIMNFIITILIIRYFYKYSSNVYYCVFFYLTIGLFTMAMSGLRQTLAISLTLIAFDYIISKKLFKYLLCIICAISIHNSSWVFLPMYFLRNIKLSKKKIVLILIASILSLIYRPIIPEVMRYFLPKRYETYSLFTNYSMNPIIILINIAIPIFCLIYISDFDNKERTKLTNKTSILFVFSSLNILFTILTMNSDQIGRLAYYFSMSNIVLISEALNSVQNNKMKRLYTVILLFLCLIYFFVSTPGGTLAIDNYKFFWE